MEIINHPQKSQEWLAVRARFFTASEAPAAIGVSKYTTRTELLQQKATGIAKEIDASMQRRFDAGDQAESAARIIAEAIVGEDLFPATVTDEIEGLPLLASLDGMTMTGDTLWEHKLYNADLARIVRDCRLFENTADLPLHYIMQIEQQLLVTGAEKVLFMCSDGTEERCEWVWYSSNPVHRQALIAGWKQFADDLAAYQHIEDAPKPEGKAPETLPALRIELTGMVTASNLVEFKRTAMAVIDSVNTDLQTDKDFADAEKAVKWCSDVESRLKAAKEHALSQTASIDELFRTLDAISEEARRKRLDLTNLVKSRKESIRVEIMQKAKQAYDSHVAALIQETGGPWIVIQSPQFAEAIKNKRTIASLRDAVDGVLANAKISADASAKLIRSNLATIKTDGEGYEFLFSDRLALISKSNDDLVLLIKSRIAEHKAAEQKRQDEERATIRAEEEARANREAEQKAEQERERIRAEERASLEREEAARYQASLDRQTSAAIQKLEAEKDLRGKPADTTHGEPKATATDRVTAASTSPIKRTTFDEVIHAVAPAQVAEALAPTGRPTDAAIIDVVANHFGVRQQTVIDWIINMDISKKRYQA